MPITGIGSAAPPTAFDKAACLAAFERPPWITRLNPCSIDLLRLVLQQDNGIDSLQLAVDSRNEAFSIDPDTLARRFETLAPQLAAQAGRRALDDAGLVANEVDAAVASTCTGALCPGLSGHRIEQLGLRPDVLTHDLVGQDRAAAVPNLQLANALVLSRSAGSVLSVCVAMCSAAMYLDSHPGWRDALQAQQRRLELRPEDLRHSADMLRRHGNLSSALVCFVLRAAVAEPAPAGWGWLSSFGAGLACHGALLEVG